MSGRHFDIAGRRIGDSAPVYVVAELSANHAGKLETALKTIDAAAEAGADAIKLQTYTPDTLTLRSDAPPFVVKTKNVWAGRTLHDLYAEAMTPWEWHSELIARASARGLACFSTPFDATATELLASLDVPAYKIASFELVDLPLIEHVAARGKPMILSTGMATLGEIERAVAACRNVGNHDIALLRCVSSYPASPDSMDLRALETLRSFDVVVGLSDHTRDATVAIASVALGAKVIEKHFILDRAVGGPDAFFSLEPHEFCAMVDAVRSCEAALGRPRFGPGPEEKGSLAFRRSLFFARDVRAGATLTCDDVRSVRPSDGLDARELPNVLGSVAARDVAAGTPVSWTLVGSRAPASAVTLRPATSDDAADLLALRNDPETRKASLATEEVTQQEHGAWLNKVLTATDRALYVAQYEGRFAGQARLDSAGPATEEVSIAVHPEARRRGVGIGILRAIEAVARERGTQRLVAKVRPENTASVRLFKTAGYYAFVERTGPVSLLVCERRIAPFA